MALRTPPSWLQNGSHPAENDRLTTQAFISSTGTIGTSSMQVTAQGSPNMTVNIASGWAGILSSTSNAGVYIAYNDATVVATITTADATNPRIDRVVATVNDAYYSGSTNTVVYAVVAGTPAASPSAPATPNNSISLATIAVAANTTTITSGNITDTRVAATSNLTSGYLPLSGGTLTGGLTAVAGNTTIAPIKLQTGAAFNSPLLPGTIEYDGNAAYLTPSSAATSTTNGGRALFDSTHRYQLTADSTITATAGAPAFGVRLTTAANTTYEFEAVMAWSVSCSTGAGSLSLGTAGTATVTTIDYQIQYNSPASGLTTSASMSSIGTQTHATNYSVGSSASPGVPVYIRAIVKGVVRITTAGTFGIQAQVSSNTTATLLRDSFVKITPIGSNTNPSIGAWA